MRALRVTFIGVLLALGAIGRADDAAEKQRARQLLQQGNALYAAGSYEAALALFHRAYMIFPSPKLLVNTAACEKALGHRERAASDLGEFLRLHDADRAPPPEQEILAARARAELDALRPGLGRIVVDGLAPGGAVSVDGDSAWRNSYVVPGEHRVALREPGRPDYEARLRVAADATSRVGRSVPPPHVAVVAPTPPGPGPALDLRARPPRRRAAWVLPVAIGVSVAVVAGVGVGLGLGLGLHRDPAPPRGDVGTVRFTP